MSKILGVIPARYDSVRLPGKVMIELAGKTIIQRVIEQVEKSGKLSQVIVATDNELIFNHIKDLGKEVMMTAKTHRNGTERCTEVAQKLGSEYEVVINIQGDEPFIAPSQINALVNLFKESDTEIGTLVKKIDKAEEIFAENEAKVVFNERQEVLLFSRSPIPYFRDKSQAEWHLHHDYYKHIGIYGFRSDILANISKLAPTPLELAESLEQLRWLAHYKINVGVTDSDVVPIDTQEDLEKAIEFLKNNPQFD